MNITTDFKKKVATALADVRKNYTGTDAAFAKSYGIKTASVYSRIKAGHTEEIVNDSVWLNIGRELNVTLSDRKWNAAKTEVFLIIEEDINFCQTYSKAKICVDDCGIGKTFTAKYLSKTRQNCFYVDASQAKTKQLFIRLLAKTLGLDAQAKLADVKENIKYYLKMLPSPVVIIDEAGDLDYNAFLELKELWNATENACGWYLMGADGLREKISRGIRSKRVGYRELFSRFSENYTTAVPTDRNERIRFYKELITDVLKVNVQDPADIAQIVRACLTQDSSGQIGGLRRAESLLIIKQKGI